MAGSVFRFHLRFGYHGEGAVCLVDSDSPTLPSEALITAIQMLEKQGERIILGPSNDEGYYLIGMKQQHPEVFVDIAWSTSAVLGETMAAVERIGAELITLPLWYDVDDAATLSTLQDELLHHRLPPFASLNGFSVPSTHAFLRRLDLNFNHLALPS